MSCKLQFKIPLQVIWLNIHSMPSTMTINHPFENRMCSTVMDIGPISIDYPHEGYTCRGGINLLFLHDQLRISPWIRTISNELDITFHVSFTIVWSLWRHHQNVNRTSETRGRCVKIVALVVINEYVISCKKKIHVFPWRCITLIALLFSIIYVSNSETRLLPSKGS